jgi:hypothetical protein
LIIAIPTGLLTACAYERGEETIGSSALVQAGTKAVAFRRDRRAAGHGQGSQAECRGHAGR